MGQEILYCFKCQTRLLGSDFERGKAFRVEAQAACPTCVRDLLAHLPDPDAEIERLKRTAVPKSSGNPSSSTKLPPVSTSRIPAQPPRTADASRQPSRMPLVIAAVVGGVVVLILAVMVSGSKEIRPPSVAVPTPDPIPIPVPRPVPADPVARDLEELDARLALPLRQEKVQEAAGMLQAARGKHASVDWSRALDERMQKIEIAARRIAVPILEKVGPAAKRKDQAALKELRGRLESMGLPSLISEYEAAVAAATPGPDPWTVLDVQSLKSLEGATLSKHGDFVLASGHKPNRDTYTMTAQVGLRGVRAFRLEAMANESLAGGGPGRAYHGNFVLTEFKVESGGRALAFSGASATFEQAKYPASAAIDGKPLSGWGVLPRFGVTSAAFFHLPAPVDLESVTIVLEHESNHHGYQLGCFRISAGVAELPPPPAPRFAEEFVPKAPEVKEPPGVAAYRARWAAAAKPAAARDFARAVKALEEIRGGLADEASRKEADGDLADFKLAAETLAELPRLLPKWTKGTKIELQFIGDTGSAERVEGTVLEATARGVTIQAEGGTFDVPAGELASGSIATLLALRGEKKPTDARAVAVFRAFEGSAGDLSGRYAEVRAALDPKESEARRLFWVAEEDFSAMKTRGTAAAVYEKLLADPTFFSSRNKAFLEERVAASRELFFFADDLAAGGTFSLASAPRLETYWISTAESPGKAAANFVEAELFVAPGAAYRGWVFAGGCCQEVFTFYLQGTGLSGPSAKNPRETVTAAPGGDDWIVVRVPTSNLKKKHADHTGPKEPDRWMWVDLGALKFADAGPKKLRILTEQKGLGVAYLAVGPARQAAPREAEVKELLKNRPPPSYQATGTILREIWRGIRGDAIAELTSVPKFKERPDESGMITHIDSWNMGNDYGCRIRGYVHPPVTGEYVFWIASDDHGELWLSADDSPEKKQKICHLNHPVGQRDWGSDGTQKSAGIPLVAGRRYYIEVLQKQGGGGEHVAAGWTLPGGAQERPIPPSRLSPIGAVAMRKAVRPSFVRSFSPDAPVVRSAGLGGPGGRDFELAPNPRQLVRGFHLRVSSGFLGSVKPVFQGPKGDVDGALAGEGNAKTEVIGRPGYVVGGLVVRATDRVNSVKVIFVKLSGNRLVPGDRYETEWFGSRPGGTETMLGDGVTPVVGIFGRHGSWIDALGLVLQGR